MTKSTKLEAASAGLYTSSCDERTYARIQILTIADLLKDGRIAMPSSHDIRAQTFKEAPKARREKEEQELFPT